MQVTLLVYGHSREYFPGVAERHVLQLPGPLSIDEILRKHLRVDPSLVMAVMTGGRRYSREYVPQDGEEVVLLSPASGG